MFGGHWRWYWWGNGNKNAQTGGGIFNGYWRWFLWSYGGGNSKTGGGLFGGLWRWFWFSGGLKNIQTDGEIVRRLSELLNIFRQASASHKNVPTKFQRIEQNIIFTGNNPMPILVTVLAKTTDEIVTYLFDYSNFPEVLNGDALSSPTVTATGLTVSGVAITATKIQGIPAGQGVQATVSGGVAQVSYPIECLVTMSSGDKRAIKGIIAVE